MAAFHTLSGGNIGRTVSIVDAAAGTMQASISPADIRARNASGMGFP